ncbi:MAG TPA: metallophosphoesterase family protein [Methylibium sp.]|nr:metallophosphoesterase family protein [Methylibium sp.]
MRIAAVSDIHGNLPALEAVLAEIEHEDVDLVVNLGDLVSGPLWPLETARRLMALDWPTIRGNHERQLLSVPLDQQGDSDAQACRALGDAERAWLAALPNALRLPGDMQCCHGTPSSDLQYLLETVVDGFDAQRARCGEATAHGLRAATADEVTARIGGGRHAAVLLCGHSHVPRILPLPGGALVVNPGSVGLPAYDDAHPLPHWVENDGPQARWALLERDVGGRWSARLRATGYDHAHAARRAEAHHRGDWADALRTGRVGRTEREALAPRP